MRSATVGLVTGFLIILFVAGSCTSNGTSIPSSIVMVTDKTHYAQGETVTLKVTNDSDIPIWYIGYPQSDLVFWKIERARDDGWEVQDFRLPLVEGNTEVCQLILYERPVGNVTELKPHSDMLYEWNQKICLFGLVTEPTEPEIIERGTYRFTLSYSLDTVETEDTEAEPWKRPIELGEIEIVYSNEFIFE